MFGINDITLLTELQIFNKLVSYKHPRPSRGFSYGF